MAKRIGFIRKETQSCSILLIPQYNVCKCICPPFNHNLKMFLALSVYELSWAYIVDCHLDANWWLLMVREVYDMTKTIYNRRPLTSLGMFAWPHRVTTKYSYIKYVHIRCWIKNNCANTVIWWRIINPYLDDVACQASWRHLSSEARGPKARPCVQYHKDCTWPIKSQNTNMDLFHNEW